MSFNIGDVVRIGKGKVEYTVFDAPAAAGFTVVQSNNTGKVSEAETDRLTLVTAARNAVHATEEAINAALAASSDTDDVDFSAMPGPVAIPENEIMAPWEIELLHGVNPKRPFLLTVDGVTTAHKSYGAACDALIVAARQGIQHYAVIDHEGQRKATRTAA